MADLLRFDNGNDSNDDYEPTDSEDEYSEGEKELLKEVRERNKRDVNEKQELMAFDDSDDEDADADEQNDADDDDDDEDMHDSDIEGAEDDSGIPDSKDWGSKSRNYYNTDFVDQDYSTYNEQEEEMAKQEEEEAKIIQMRLAKQMKEEDFQFDDVLNDASAAAEDGDKAAHKESITMPSDLSGLSKREKQRLFQKDSPEFAGLIADFEKYLDEEKQLLEPVLTYVHTQQVPLIPALKYAQLYQNVSLTYCTNVAFYLLLKAKRVNVRNHPITKRLVQLKKLLAQLSDKHENIIRPQLEALLERIQDGDAIAVKHVAAMESPAKAKKTKLSVLAQYEQEPKRRKLQQQQQQSDDDDDEDDDEEDQDEDDVDDGEQATADDDERRGITYQIAKNKGLKVHRKKEQRNPRVKHRSKFRKALIRRKGAVRTVRKETQRYGGEMSGIKATVSKSVKFRS